MANGDIDNNGKYYEDGGRFYEIISGEKAAERILSEQGYCGFGKPRGHESEHAERGWIIGCYIRELSFKILKELAEEDTNLTDKIESNNKEIKVPVKIYNCIIGKAYFKGATFSKRAYFWHATFSGEVNFLGTTFSGKADFRYAKFSKEAYFWHATFSKGANFLDAKFNKEAYFWRVTFSGEANFLDAKFSKEAYFTNNEEIWNLIMKRVRFEKSADFRNSKFTGTTDFTETIFRETAFFSGSSFEEIVLKDCSIAQNLELKWEQVYDTKKKKSKLKNHIDKKHEEATDEYRRLKENFRRLGRYKDEDNAYYQMQECKRRAGGSPILWLWWLIIGHGVRPKRIFLTIGIVILFFAFLFGINHSLLYMSHKPTDSCVFNSIYFSAITFATVGFGDISAQGWLAGAAMIEGLLGIVLNAALVVVIFRKIVR